MSGFLQPNQSDLGMELHQAQSIGILYNLAMTMAGETRPRPLATVMLQQFLAHTGCACGALVLDAQMDGAGEWEARVYAAIGNPALRALEGQRARWPRALLQDARARSMGQLNSTNTNRARASLNQYGASIYRSGNVHSSMGSDGRNPQTGSLFH